METNVDQDMYLFDSTFGPASTAFSSQPFDDFLATGTPGTSVSSTATLGNANDSCPRLSPKSFESSKSVAKQNRSPLRPGSQPCRTHPSTDLSKLHAQLLSSSAVLSGSSDEGMQDEHSRLDGLTMPVSDDLFGVAHANCLDEYDATDSQMASDFDFETAGSTPSGFESNPFSTAIPSVARSSFRASASFSSLTQLKKSSPRLPAGHGKLYFGTSRETSPLNAMLPTSSQSAWAKNSPSSGLEETFNGITMNGDSPGNSTFSPSLQFASSALNFDPSESSATPSTIAKDLSSPPSTANSADSLPILTVNPTSLKSRVETQIPIKMTLMPLPIGVTKLRLPTYTVSKPKFLAKPEADRSPEILELFTSLVCTSAMQDPSKLERALARARGEEVGPPSKLSPTSSMDSQSSKDADEKPLDGGEVRICSGCIQRERKRASRKKQKKPHEEEMFQKDEEKRIIVFNTSEIKVWAEPAKDASTNTSAPPAALVTRNAAKDGMQVDLPMRIACYCRHQNEKLGFQVIFTVKDYMDKVVAQAMSNSIMITDDHKTHNAPVAVPSSNPSLPNPPHLPGAGVFSTANADSTKGQVVTPKMFKQSLSTTDLQGLQHNFNPHFPMSTVSQSFGMPSATSSVASGMTTPRNLSRPASPTGFSGPSKRRKQSGSGKIPAGLTMTRLEISQPHGGFRPASNTPTTAGFPPNFMNSQLDRLPPAVLQQTYGTGPPTPTRNETGGFGASVNRSFSMENLPRQAMISAPSSRHPSRPNSPDTLRSGFVAEQNNKQSRYNQLYGHQARRPPPVIHKLVPAEGSVTGGTEVTLLGNGFYQGLEVMFGDVEATTTTFWGEKCLNCITPPSLGAGNVAVVFKHDHHQYLPRNQPSQSRHTFFAYVDDREVEMYRLALKQVGKQMHHPTEDPYSAAQQLLAGPPSTLWSGT